MRRPDGAVDDPFVTPERDQGAAEVLVPLQEREHSYGRSNSEEAGPQMKGRSLTTLTERSQDPEAMRFSALV